MRSKSYGKAEPPCGGRLVVSVFISCFPFLPHPQLQSIIPEGREPLASFYSLEINKSQHHIHRHQLYGYLITYVDALSSAL